MPVKRKRLAEPVRLQPAKRQQETWTTSNARSNPLCNMLREYGMLEAVVSNLAADDLLALALTSKALHKAIMPRSVSLENLLGRLKCSGKGIGIRDRRHKKSKWFYECNCTEWVMCGSWTPSRTVETKPCVTCKVATCNECRVHCVYQSIFLAPDGYEELPNFSGFVLLEPHEHGILSPHHLALDHPSLRWQNPTDAPVAPYHDQGYLDAPLLFDAYVPAESIEEVLDFDLGQQPLRSIVQESRYECPPSVLDSLCEVTEARKINLCEDCFRNCAPRGPAAMKAGSGPIPSLPWLPHRAGSPAIVPCECTLRKRFLDRWLCLRCYEGEETIIKASTGPCSRETMGYCRCGNAACHVLCLWCWGKVAEEERDDDDIYDTIDNTASLV